MPQIFRNTMFGSDLLDAAGQGVGDLLNVLAHNKAQKIAKQQGIKFWKGLDVPDNIAEALVHQPESIQKAYLEGYSQPQKGTSPLDNLGKTGQQFQITPNFQETRKSVQEENQQQGQPQQRAAQPNLNEFLQRAAGKPDFQQILQNLGAGRPLGMGQQQAQTDALTRYLVEQQSFNALNQQQAQSQMPGGRPQGQMGIPGAQQQQVMPQQQSPYNQQQPIAPQPLEQPFGERALPGGFKGAKALAREIQQEKMDIERKKLAGSERKETREVQKEARQYLSQFEDKKRAAKNDERSWTIIKDGIKSGNLNKPWVQKAADHLGISELINNPTTNLVQKEIARLGQNAPAAFGPNTRFTNFLESTYQKSLASVYNDPKANLALAESAINQAKATQLQEEAREKIVLDSIKETGFIPPNIDSLAYDAVKDQVTKLHDDSYKAVSNAIRGEAGYQNGQWRTKSDGGKEIFYDGKFHPYNK